MEEGLKNLLKEGAGRLGVELDNTALGRFSTYLDELKSWNKKINLTSIESDREIVIRHFLDSLTPYRAIKSRFPGKASIKVLDVGSGAGFPGIPLKIADPGLEITLVDSVSKKIHFLKHIIRTLALPGIEALSARIEDTTFVERFSNRFDVVISRAFAGLGDFLEMSQPYVAPGGFIIAMKGPKAKEELRPLEYPVKPEVLEAGLPFTERKTILLVFKAP